MAVSSLTWAVPLPPASVPPAAAPAAPSTAPVSDGAAPAAAAPVASGSETQGGGAPSGDATTPVQAPLPAPTPGFVERAVPTADALPRESDHDAVSSAWGVSVTPLATRIPVFALRSGTGCLAVSPTTGNPTIATVCPSVNVSAVAVRYWMTRNLAANGGLAFALGGGSSGPRLLDTYLAIGPTLGLSLLLGNWKHMAVMASPGFSAVLFRAAGTPDTTYVVDFHADLEGELHLGFWGMPALSLSLRSGLLLRIERARDLTQWSVTADATSTLRSLVTDVTLRYYF